MRITSKTPRKFDGLADTSRESSLRGQYKSNEFKGIEAMIKLPMFGLNMEPKNGALQMCPLIPLSENYELMFRMTKNQGLCFWVGTDKLEAHGNYTETRPKEAMFTNQ